MNNNNENKEWSLWSFLEEHKIEVPIIQRDYAQGRVGKEYLRKNFLSDIKRALVGDLPNGEKELKVDFVYGPEDNGVLQLLDGQQRLTTLWLLHWYIALRAGAESLEEACERLKNFSYATRATSRAFCEQLCRSKNFEAFNDDKIVQFIKDSTWFYSAWEQDPTIQSMLRMLEGTKINNKKGSDITDGLEELFVGKERTDFEEYWWKLTKEAPIVFHHLTLEDFDLYDDLYVKMNQRGKKLTSFENFKADLIRYIRGQAAEEGSRPALLDIELSMDTTWTDIFWKNKSKDCSVDEIYFTFLNRFFMNYRIKDLSSGDKYYEYFNNDTAIVYSSLDNYKWEIGDGEDKGIDIGLFKDLSTILNNYYNFQKGKEKEDLMSIFECPWGISFEFIPTYKGDSSITPFNMIQRVVFYAVCKYFQKGEAKEERLRQWMRFVWNLVSVKIIVDHEMTESYYIGNDINKVKEVIGIIDSIDNYHKVYECLKDLNMEKFIGEKESALFERFKEEKEKACKILEGSEVWKNAIEKAEEYSFFNGGIGFLFRGENGELDDWGSFSQKWENVQKYFRGGKSDTESCMNGEYDNAYLLKTLIGFLPATAAMWNNSEIPLRGCDLKDDVDGRGKPLYNNKAATWRYLLNNKAIYGAVHKLLLGYDLEEIKNGKERSNQRVLWTLSQTKLLDYVITEVKYPLRYRLSDIFEAFFNKGPRIRILMDSYDKNMAFEESLKSRGDIGDLDLHKLYSKGHFICQERDKEGGKEKWSNYKILIPETGNKLPISKYIEDYPEVKKTDSDS